MCWRGSEEGSACVVGVQDCVLCALGHGQRALMVEVLEVMCCVLFCILEAVEVDSIC